VANLVESRPMSEQEMGLRMPRLVLDLTRLMPGPLAAQMLHRMGLRVLPITAPTEDLLLQFAPDVYDQLQAGKETQMLDLNTTEGRELLLKMVQKAAVMIESNLPGTMERLGVGRRY
jgi:alpha-methylacyl-CoA racemase